MPQWKKYLLEEWSWKRPFKSLAAIYVILFVIVFSCSNRLIYMPPETRYSETTPNITLIPIFLGDQYPNIKRIGAIHTPLLIIHGNEDTIVAPWNGQKLYDLHPGPKRFVEIEGAGHNDLFILAEDDILDALDQFSKAHLN